MKKMISKYPGTCTRCKQSFPIGTEIEWAPGSGARHPVVNGTYSTCPVKDQKFETFKAEVAYSDAIVDLENAGLNSAPETMVPGFYEVGDAIYAVKMRKDKTGLYAMKMVEVGDGVVRATESGERVRAIEFEYAYGVVLGFTSKVIKLSDRMSVERAKELATLYGRCIACRTKLRAAKSVEDGIGPVCIKNFGPVIQPTATTVDGRQVIVAA